MSRIIFCIGVNCILAAVLVSGEIYASVKGFQELVTTLNSVTECLSFYMDMEMEKLALVREYLNKLKREQMETVADIQEYAGNPLHRFLLIKRLTTDLQLIKEVANNKTEFEPPLNVTTEGNPVRNLTYPSREDLVGAARNLARLQETYLLDVHQLAAGRVRGSFSTPMTANDCYEVGRLLYEDGSSKASTGWLLEAYHMVDPAEARHQPMLVAKTIEALCYAYFSLDDMDNVNKWVQKLKELEIDPKFMAEVRGVLSAPKNGTNETESTKNLHAYITNKNMTRDYERLCRGEMEPPPEIKYRLKCQYLMDKPFLMLAPLKMEQLYINPDILLFYDVISDSEIEQIKTAGSPNLHRSMVNLSNGSKVVITHRVSMVSWLTKDDAAVTDKIYTRIKDMTGLSNMTAERIQLAAYSPGGFYKAHFDVSNETYVDVGHRIATVMFYLSDVEAGGATVFVKLGLAVFPVKGAALFWYNVHRCGTINKNLLHAACPVLLGHKWAANIWMGYDGQEFLYPCKIGGDQINDTLSPPVWKPTSEAGSSDEADLKNSNEEDTYLRSRIIRNSSTS